MQFFQALQSFHFLQIDTLHLVGNLQRECGLFIQFDVVVSHFGGKITHNEGFQLDNLIFNGREAFVIVQEQSLYPRQTKRYAKLGGNGVERFSQIGLFQSIDNPDRIVTELGTQHFHSHRSGHAEPDNAILAYTHLPGQIVEIHAIAFGLNAKVGSHPFEGLRLLGCDGFLA